MALRVARGLFWFWLVLSVLWVAVVGVTAALLKTDEAYDWISERVPSAAFGLVVGNVAPAELEMADDFDPAKFVEAERKSNNLKDCPEPEKVKEWIKTMPMLSYCLETLSEEEKALLQQVAAVREANDRWFERAMRRTVIAWSALLAFVPPALLLAIGLTFGWAVRAARA
jgi:hypothetical protein